jgi:hypothetical protein
MAKSMFHGVLELRLVAVSRSDLEYSTAGFANWTMTIVQSTVN